MSAPYLSDVFEDVAEEGDRARQKFGEQRELSDGQWLAILMEEVGEAATETLDVPGASATRLRAEVVQVAAVAMRWVQVIDGRVR